MTKNRFFPLIWRINALVILAFGLAALSGLLFSAVLLYRDLTHARHAEGVLDIVEKQADTAKASLGDFHAVEGTTVLRASLNLRPDSAAGYSSKGTSPKKNYLYFDTLSHASYWLMPGNRGVILGTTELSSPSTEQPERATLQAIVYELVDADTNGDGKLTGDDLVTIGVSDPVGRRFVRLLSKVEHFNSAHLGKGTLVVLYASSGKLRAAEVDLNSHKIVRESTLQPFEQEVLPPRPPHS